LYPKIIFFVKKKGLSLLLANTNVINKVTSPPPLPCGVVEFTPQGKPSPLEGEGRVGGKKINSFVLV
jgi:hypothetical protein